MRRWITIMLPLVVLAAAVYMRVESPVIVNQLLDQARKDMVDVIDLSVLYEERLTDFKANPPGEDWDGVFVATSK